jgi:hypothetical protein
MILRYADDGTTPGETAELPLVSVERSPDGGLMLKCGDPERAFALHFTPDEAKLVAPRARVLTGVELGKIAANTWKARLDAGKGSPFARDRAAARAVLAAAGRKAPEGDAFLSALTIANEAYTEASRDDGTTAKGWEAFAETLLDYAPEPA